MVVTITGGSGSGKSEMAEAISQALCGGPKIYAATMQLYDEESRKRIERHRKQREGKQFTTLECPSGMEKIRFPGKMPLILLECVSNLAANELYSGANFGMRDPEETIECVIRGIEHFVESSEHLVVVTNELFQDGIKREELGKYLYVVGMVNQYLMDRSDVFIESVYGLPYFWKRDERLRREKGIWVWKSED